MITESESIILLEPKQGLLVFLVCHKSVIELGMNVLSEHLVTEADVPYCKYLASFSYNDSLITLCWKLSNNVLHKTIDLLKSFKVDECICLLNYDYT